MSGENLFPVGVDPSAAEREPYSGQQAEAIYAMWHDPLTYDHMKHGPPYLPEPKMRLANDQRTETRALLSKEAHDSEAAVVQAFSAFMADYNAPGAELAALLAFMRAEVHVHQTHHWQTRGCSFYGDHLLFERVYGDTSGMLDGIAERAVGIGNHMLVQPIVQCMQTTMAVRILYEGAPANPSAEAYVWFSLRAVMRTMMFMRLVYESLKDKGALTNGLDNMLQDMADKHETLIYLLKQRATAKHAGDKAATRLEPGDMAAYKWLKAERAKIINKAMGAMHKELDALQKQAESKFPDTDWFAINQRLLAESQGGTHV